MITFDEKYNREEFTEFLRGFLPQDCAERVEDMPLEKQHKGRYKKITKAQVLWKCESLGDLHILEMTHKQDDPRVAIATDAFKIMADHWIHRALVVFKNDESDTYRFSHLTISLDENEKGAVVRRYSNARRHSFLLGVGAKVKTPQKQLSGRVKDYDDLLERFSLEVVNKDFYDEIVQHFNALIDSKKRNLNLPLNDTDIERKNFAMRLIGRIMFCWFLKQKSSKKGGQLIPNEILSSSAVEEGYYHTILEPLFFEVLNEQRDYRRPQYRNNLYDTVPYLNGSLFTVQKEDYYAFDKNIFASKYADTLKISDEWFRNFFSFLETYHFTIDENMVFDQELSVDPEMLGRIFENLLAEINPDTGGSERKRTGSYYTPRQIVEYMVDQSLTEYLKTKTGVSEEKIQALISYDLNDDKECPVSEYDEKKEIIKAIDDMRVLDPACGSGAFPMGVLQKIVWVLQQIDPECVLWVEHKLAGVPDRLRNQIAHGITSHPFNYIRKLEVIKKSIFGADIQKIAVEISRLRCFLTLIVESKIDDNELNRGIESLPNLDFKFVCANTLVGLPKSGSNGLYEDHSGINELSDMMKEYFDAIPQRKIEIANKFQQKQKEILKESLTKYGKDAAEMTEKIMGWNPFTSESSSWFDPEWMFGVEGKFDIVIGNPPYVKTENMDSATIDTLTDYIVKEGNEREKRLDDLYVHFIFAGMKYTRDEGVFTYITNDSFIGLANRINVRDLFLKNDLIKLVRCPFETFDANIYTAVFVARKGKSKNKKYEYGKFEYPYFSYNSLGFVSHEVINFIPDRKFIPPSPVLPIFEKLSGLKKIKEYVNILDTGIDSGNVRSKIFFRHNSDNTLDRMLQGRQIEQYGVFWDRKEAQYKYCDIHYVCKDQRGIGRGGKESKKNEYWKFRGEIENHHQLERLLMRQSDDDLIVAYHNEKKDGRYYTDNTLFTVLPKQKNVSLKYTCALLNSTLLNTIYHFLSQEKGKAQAQVKTNLVGELPFKVENEKQVIDLVDKILDITREEDYLENQDKKNKVEEYKQEIENLVWDIYGLTDKEKQIIKES